MKLEEDIMATMRDKLTMDKASQYAQKMASKVRQRIAEAVSTVIGLMHFKTYIHEKDLP